MRPTPRLLVFVSLVTLAAHAAAKKPDPKPEPLDAPPVLVSTRSNAPKWKNVDELKQFAQRGDPKACLELGMRSMEGDGVPRDLKQAEQCFERAAKAGLADGWFRLGKIYHDGLDGAPDYAKAVEYFTLAARGGIAEAQHNLGAMLVSARGVKRNYVEGLAWLIVAKKSGAASDAEEQVRNRLSRRPADLAAAETRAAEITADLPNASVRTEIPPPRAEPAKPILPGNGAAPKPNLVVPKLEPMTPPKVMVPIDPAPPAAPGKP
jgi:hypothetical protein